MRRPLADAEALKLPGMPPLRVATPVAGQPAPPPFGPVHARMGELAEAISGQQIDLYLEPIVALVDRRTRHHEFSIRIRTANNGSVGGVDYLPVLRGTGILPLLDTLSVSRLARVADQTLDSPDPGLLFCTVSGESLLSSEFMDRIGEICPPGSPLSRRLVLAFGQSDVRQLTPPQWAAVAKLADAGLGLAIDRMAALEMKLTTLRAAGFRFAKLDAKTVLEGLPGRQGSVNGRDLCRHAKEAELALIADHIDNERQVAGLVGLGIAFGQGPVLGAARAVLTESRRAAGGVAA
jgi:cyclic-di-GMP phosphodiesterase TipF (flagellum assembly factor)